jgi:hypothetical protein
VQTETTFKTVLLNSQTSAAELVRQAMQRFRLPAGDAEDDYFLMIKVVEGGSAELGGDERPLGVFESLVEAAAADMLLPRVKRSSVGSISSVASNLSMHPATKNLPTNDFTDDSAVKVYPAAARRTASSFATLCSRPARTTPTQHSSRTSPRPSSRASRTAARPGADSRSPVPASALPALLCTPRAPPSHTVGQYHPRRHGRHEDRHGRGRAVGAKAKAATTTCTICGQQIEVDELQEHMRIDLLDPR